MRSIGHGPEDVEAAKAVLTNGHAFVDATESYLRNWVELKAIRENRKKCGAAAREAEAKGCSQAAEAMARCEARWASAEDERLRWTLDWLKLQMEQEKPLQAAALLWGFDLEPFGWGCDLLEAEPRRLEELKKLAWSLKATARVVLTVAKLKRPMSEAAEAVETREEAAPPVLVEEPGPGFTSMRWGSERFTFKAGRQAETFRMLFEAHGHTLTNERIGEEVSPEAKRFRVDDVFRNRYGGYHPALHRMIRKDENGGWRYSAPMAPRNAT